jgi:hypothetical protein
MRAVAGKKYRLAFKKPRLAIVLLPLAFLLRAVDKRKQGLDVLLRGPAIKYPVLAIEKQVLAS